ncbi:peroxiredoxin family protein [Undibacterium flavidum]|uniref:Redoxin domain-containing protein n=1 Tax=Undibacterium flavidum TaxID=2762297 RepID=A0ABR6Y6J1_9BURK|nr:redoxin domain-containing protein [Undibacterium flavidum]MBC3872232.1 redoxin domain-containing protein [Undibacterium flavidum]
MSWFVFAIGFSTPNFAQQIKATAKLGLIGTDYTGKKIDLRNYAGKTVLVSFYSAGCSVCARDLKLMREFYRDNNAKNFVLIGVNTDKTRADFNLYTQILAASIPKNQQFPLIWRGNAEAITGFGQMNADPSHFLISPDGQISLKREGTFKAEDWDSLWESLHQ